MKRFLTVIGIAGILVLVLGATAFAARGPQSVAPQAGATAVPAAPTTAPSSIPQSSAQQPSSSDCCVMPFSQTGRRMGMMGGAGTVQAHMGIAGYDTSSMMAGVTPMHDDVELLLGMNHQDLYNQMAAGKSLAQIAADQGVTEQQLLDGIMAGRRAAFDQAVAAGRMTWDQADAMLGYMQNNIRLMVDAPGMGLGTGGWGMMWNTQPSQPGQSGQQIQPGQTGMGANFPGPRFGPGGMHR